MKRLVHLVSFSYVECGRMNWIDLAQDHRASSIGSAYRLVVGTCECGNKPSSTHLFCVP